MSPFSSLPICSKVIGSYRQGFSILEIMIALSILASGIMSIMSQQVTLQSSREMDRNGVVIELLANEMVERFQGGRWESIGTSSLPWSVPRHLDGSSVSGPMQDADLIANNLITLPSGIAGLKVYVEYYRAMATKDAAGNVVSSGMMDGEGNTYAGLDSLRAVWNKASARNAYRLEATSTSPTVTTQVDEGTPVIIRIEIQGTNLPRPRVLFTGRKQ